MMLHKHIFIVIALIGIQLIGYAADAQVSINDIAKAVEMLINEVNDLKKSSSIKFDDRDKRIGELQNKIEQLQVLEDKVERLESDKQRYVVHSPTESTEPQKMQLETKVQTVQMPTIAEVVGGKYEAMINVRVRSNPTRDSQVVYVVPGGAIVTTTRIESGMGFIGDGWVAMKYFMPLRKERN